MRLALLLFCMACLGACDESAAPTSEQDRGLNQADAMLNEASNGLESVDDQGLDANVDANAL